MKKVLYILGELTDLDIEWMIRNGSKKKVGAGKVIIEKGKNIDALYILLEGSLSVHLGGNDGPQIAELGVGEIVGEISFVDSRPPAASVKALEDATLLVIDRTELNEKLGSDAEFAGRFYRAIAVFLANRLRGTQRQLEYNSKQSMDEDEVYDDELDMNVLDTVYNAGSRFTRILQRMLKES